MHDNDAAGRKAADTFVWGQSAYVITTPDAYSDVDELFNAKPKAEGVLAWLQRTITEAPYCIRPIEATAAQVDEIRANENKEKAHRVEETLCKVILSDMRERAEFVVDTLPYAWLPESKQLIKLKKDSPEFYSWLGQYGLLEKQPHFSIVEAKVISEAIKGEKVQVHRLIHSALDSCYLSTGGDRMIKITADEIK